MLLVAVAVGQRMGNSVMQQATGQQPQAVMPTPLPTTSAAAQGYGPNWKSSQALSAAPDPRFPDPRVPPKPLPTPLPIPRATPTPVAVATPTYNPNLPVWRQKPLPTLPPTTSPEEESSPETSPTP